MRVRGRGRRLAAAAVLATLAWLAAGPALAVELPGPAALRATMPVVAAPQEVAEPHLSTADRLVRVQYLGWPAAAVLDRLLGSAWRAPGADVEFRALDGYVSRVPAERFERYRAWLVFERVGQSNFTVDNPAQNQRNVALGPYYLVWDNIGAPELLAEGGVYWPYQVSQVLVSTARRDALLPRGIAAGFDEAAAQAQKFCLACHKVNGYGGDKAPGDLAQITKALPAADFMRWVLQPSQVVPGTTMPGLPVTMAERDRQVLAGLLREYLVAVPAKP